jgi:hypothetical protein
VDDILAAILRQQASAGFPDLAGTDVSATIPVSDRLLTEIIGRMLPASSPIQDVRLEAQAGDTIKVSLRASAARLSLPLSMVLMIDRQPELPHDPNVGLRLAGMPLALSLAGPLTKFLGFLPPGITIDGDRLTVDVATLLTRHGRGDVLRHLTALRLTTTPGAVVVSLRGQVIPGS